MKPQPAMDRPIKAAKPGKAKSAKPMKQDGDPWVDIKAKLKQAKVKPVKPPKSPKSKKTKTKPAKTKKPKKPKKVKAPKPIMDTLYTTVLVPHPWTCTTQPLWPFPTSFPPQTQVPAPLTIALLDKEQRAKCRTPDVAVACHCLPTVFRLAVFCGDEMRWCDSQYALRCSATSGAGTARGIGIRGVAAIAGVSVVKVAGLVDGMATR